MGGVGSGNRCRFGRDTTDDLRSIDIRELKKKGWLKTGHSLTISWSRQGQKIASIQLLVSENHVTLDYRTRIRGEEAWQNKNYNIALDHTPCHYGGSRVWFRCPCCHKRIAILYGGALFICRHCQNLTYESQKEGELDRLTRQADKIRERLHWEGGILNGGGWKPKGMHWKTFYRLEAQHDQIEKIVYSKLKYL